MIEVAPPLSRAQRETQAALLTVHHHTGRMVLPAFFPRGPLQPPGMRAALNHLQAGDDAGRASGTRVLTRAAALATRQGSKRREYLERRLAVLTDRKVPPAKQDAVYDSARPPEYRVSPPDWSERFDGLAPNQFRSLAQSSDRSLASNAYGPYACGCCDATAESVGMDAKEFPIVHHTHDAWMDLDSFVTTVVVRLALRPYGEIKWVSEFAKCVAPTNWGTSDFFAGSFVTGKDGKVIETPGDSYDGVLHERARWTVNPAALCTFNNQLDIDFTKGPTEAKLVYSLRESESSDVAGWPQPGGLDVDDGYATIKRSVPRKQNPEGLRTPESETLVLVEVVKTIRFSDRRGPPIPGGGAIGDVLNFMAPSLVGLWLDEIVYQTAVGAIKAQLSKNEDNKVHNGKQPGSSDPANAE